MPRSLAALALALAVLSLALTGCGGGTGSSGSSATTYGSASLSASSVTFQAQSIATVSPAQTVTLTNSGSVSLSITSVSAAGDFSETNNCTTAAIAANATCSIQITFAPSATGTRTGSLILTANISSGTLTLPLSGTGLAAGAVTLTPSALTFSGTYLTTTSAAQGLTLTNTSSSSVYVQTPTLSGDFALASTTCGATLAASASCAITVDFAPTASGARTGDLTISDAGGTQTVALSGTGNTLPTGTYTGPAFDGGVRAGQQAVIGASVQLYAAGTTGNGSQGVPLLSTPVTTDSSGDFLIYGTYSCPSATSQLYIVARGGKVGTATTANPAITFISPLGLCDQPANTSNVVPQFVVDEATTAVTAWSMAQFLSTGGNIGATSTNTTGFANALATFNSLVGSGGTAPGNFPANGAAPTARINTLANLLNACAVSSSACSTLFADTAVSGSPAPANTLDAALNLVRNPGANVAALYALAGTSTAYTPALTTAPDDWTLFLTFTGGGMDAPTGIGVDSKGNVWVASYYSALSEFTPTGSPVFASGITDSTQQNLYESYGLAIAPGDNIWVPNEEHGANYLGSVSIFQSAGTLSSNFSTGGIDYPVAAAADPDGSVWIVDNNDHVSVFSANGTPLSGANGYVSSDLDFPVAIALDSSHNAYVANQSDNNVVKISPDGSQITAINCCDGASGLAVDQANNVWAANYYGDSVSEVTASGSIPFNATAAPSTAITGGGIDHPQGIAVDGAGNVWVANYRGPSLTEIAGARAATPGAFLSPTAGWAPDSAMLEAYAIAIDASGNLWISDLGIPGNPPAGGSTTGSGSYSITEFVGLAAPIKTPLLGPPQAP